jgi:glucose/arabinose dehydrogenase
VATGAKHAYAHVELTDGRLAVTEMGDGPGPPPPDEVNIVSLNETTVPNLGWPRCPSTKPPTGPCTDAVVPLATFQPSATPTGIAVDGDALLVALFTQGEIVRIPMSGGQPSGTPVASTPVVTGLQGPHTVVKLDDGTFLVSETLRGRIVAMRQ